MNNDIVHFLKMDTFGTTMQLVSWSFGGIQNHNNGLKKMKESPTNIQGMEVWNFGLLGIRTWTWIDWHVNGTFMGHLATRVLSSHLLTYKKDR